MLLCQTPDKFTRQGRVSGWERVNWAYLPSLTVSLLDRLEPLQEVTIGTAKLQEVMSGMAKLQEVTLGTKVLEKVFATENQKITN